MTWPWASPEATRQGIQQRVKTRYPAAEIQLRLYEVAFRRLLVRLELTDPGRWVLKGGVALLLRLDPSRTSNDIDIAYRDADRSLDDALAALERAFALDLGDFFAFRLIAEATAEAEEDEEGTLPLRVDALIGGRRWVTFGVDLGLATEDLPTDPVHVRDNLTGLSEVDDLPAIRALTFPHQVAQKVCAMFELHGEPAKHSSRARDLVDVAMIAAQIEDIEAGEIQNHLRDEERRRRQAGSLREPLPGHFELPTAQADDWNRRWTRATRGAAMSFEEAYGLARDFLDPVLGGTAVGRWSPARRSWPRSA